MNRIPNLPYDCGWCDHRGLVGILPDGSPTPSDNPEANTLAKCHHPSTRQNWTHVAVDMESWSSR